MSDIIKLTGLWKTKTKAGLSMLTGSLNAVTSLLVMPNTFKKSAQEPDYYVYMKAREKSESEPKPEPVDKSTPPAVDDLGF